MKNYSFQRFSQRSLLVLGVCASFLPCSWVARAAVAPVPVTVPATLLDSLLQVSELGVNRPVFTPYSAFEEKSKVLSTELQGQWGQWQVGGLKVSSSAYHLLVGGEVFARPVRRRVADNNLRFGLLGRVDGFFSTATAGRAPKVQQRTLVQSIGFYGRLQTNDPYVVEIMGSKYYPRAEYNSLFTVWGYASRVSGHVTNNAENDAPWKYWVFNLNGSIEKTIPLYDNGVEIDDIGTRWSVQLKPRVQVGFSKSLLQTFEQKNTAGSFGGTLSFQNRTRFYYQLGLVLEYQGSRTLDTSDEPTHRWNAFVGGSYLNFNHAVGFTVDHSQLSISTNADHQVWQMDVGAGYLYKKFRVSGSMGLQFGNDNYRQFSLGVKVGYLF